jgi:hypothetical protein
MNGIDIMLQESIVAAFFWVIVAMYSQQKWRMFDVFFTKKYGHVVARALYLLAWLQVFIIACLVVLHSGWVLQRVFTLGTIFLASAMYLQIKNRATPYALHHKKPFKTYLRLHTPFGLLYIGMGLVCGKYGLLLGAATYVFCAIIHSVILSRLAT